MSDILGRDSAARKETCLEREFGVALALVVCGCCMVDIPRLVMLPTDTEPDRLNAFEFDECGCPGSCEPRVLLYDSF